MKRAILFLVLGTLLSTIFNYFMYPEATLGYVVYYGFALGLSVALSYYVDRPDWPLAKKMGISMLGIAVLLAIGLIFFDFETAVPSIFRFSTVFLIYYMMASFKDSKSLRQK